MSSILPLNVFLEIWITFLFPRSVSHFISNFFVIMPLRKKFSCQFSKCNNGYYWCKGGLEKVQNKHFYRFPTNSAVNVQWKKICGINLTENCCNKYICEDHFKKEDFVNFTKHALNPFVVPSQLQSDSNLCPIEISTPFQNNPEVTNYCQPLNSVNSLVSNDLNSTSTVSQATADNISNRIDSNIASEDISVNLNVEQSLDTQIDSNVASEDISVNLNVEQSLDTQIDSNIASEDISVNLNIEQSLDTHIESVNDNSFNNISYPIKSNNFCKQDCICEDANCQRGDSDDNDDTIVTDNLTERNEIIPTRKRKTGFLTEAGISSNAMTPTKHKMYKIHRRTVNKLCKIKKSCCTTIKSFYRFIN
ncbi:uncharacterized protein [Temnothorax nylanderi]|uniref:uncharacterized protein n=1 Tax=Temnothorax nylanderi TaxID=102681 RepID=UPI003A877D88